MARQAVLVLERLKYLSQAEDSIRDSVASSRLAYVYKRPGIDQRRKDFAPQPTVITLELLNAEKTLRRRPP